MNMVDNPRAVVGDNRSPDAAKMVTEQMQSDYAALSTTVTDLLDEARALPREIDDDETKGRFASLIKRFRDTAARIEAFRVAEKEPHFRAGQAVDQFFFGLSAKINRRAKTDKPGAADVLQQRLTDYDTRKLREEQERRRLEAERLRREAEEKQRQEEEARRKAEEARLAAERARKAETIAAKTAVAEQAEAEAASAKVETEVIGAQAQEAHIQTLAKPADIMRQRTDDGTLTTMGTEPFAEIEDDTLLDKDVLWPFISLDAKAKALRAWAKTTGHNRQMTGASIGKRPKSVVR